MDDAAAESVLIDECEIDAHGGRQCGVALTEDDWPDEEGEFVDQPGDERLCREGRAADQEIRPGSGFQVVNRADVEVAFDPSLRDGRRGQGRGVDDPVRRLPGAGVLGRDVRPRGQGGSVSHTDSNTIA